MINVKKLIKTNKILLIVILVSSCRPSDECIRGYFVSGKVTDNSSNPIPGADVYSNVLGDESYRTSTNAQGEYSISVGNYGNIEKVYFVIKKAGFQDFNTEPIGQGDAACNDLYLTRNAVITP